MFLKFKKIEILHFSSKSEVLHDQLIFWIDNDSRNCLDYQYFVGNWQNVVWLTWDLFLRLFNLKDRIPGTQEVVAFLPKRLKCTGNVIDTHNEGI